MMCVPFGHVFCITGRFTMFARVFGWLGGVVEGVRGRLGFCSAVFSVGLVSLLSGSAFAQTAPESIPIEVPNIGWSALPTSMIEALKTPVVVGIGIALSIWVILKAMSLFKRAQ